MKKRLSLILAIMIVFVGLPIEDFVAWAEDGKAKINSIEVIRTYSGINRLEATYIRVEGNNLDILGKDPVIVEEKTGEPKALITIVENQWELRYKIDGMEGVSSMTVAGKSYNISGEDMPTVTGIDPSSSIVSSEETMTIKGQGFKDFENKGKINFYDNTGSVENFGIDPIEEEEIKKQFSHDAPGGAYTLRFSYKDSKSVEVPLTLIKNYVDLFTVHGKLDVSDDIYIVPNQGPTGSIVKIIGKELLSEKNMSVFFLKRTDGTDAYTIKNMGIDGTYKQNEEKDLEGKRTLDVFTVKVPDDLDQDRYYVVLTNNVDEDKDIKKVTSVKVLDDRFTVVDNDDAISIIDVNPDRGPESGIDIEIQGRYIGSLSENVFSPNTNSEISIGDISSYPDKLRVSYKSKDGSSSIGKYKLIGGDDGVDVKEITRDITVYMGPKGNFREGSSFTSSLDKLKIRVPSVSIPEGESREKDVTVHVDTLIKYIDEKEKDEKEIKITETGRWLKGKFTYDPIHYKPEIENINPDKIPVDLNNNLIEGLEIHISGKNFLKHRYIDKATEESGEVKFKMPVIDLGGQVILDPNISKSTGKRIRIPSEDIRILDSKGNLIDGTSDNNLGTKISIKIPADIKIDKGVLDQISKLKVTNPIKNDQNIIDDKPDEHLGLSDEENIIFVKVGADKTPNITQVVPNIITSEGEDGIKITGSKFDEEVKVYLDGEEIRGVKRNGTGTELIFDAPPRPEGIYQIIVQNEEGGLAIYDDFVYVKTYTDIKLNNFNPKNGTANTLVTVQGKNFVRPNPLVSDLSGMGIYKLIGTRVLLGDRDVNEYYIEGDKISLQGYTSDKNDEIIKIEDNKLSLSDYYHSIIFEDKNQKGKYYTIFFDTNSGEIKLTDGDKSVYILEKKGNEIVATKDGEEYYFEVKKNSLVIGKNTETITLIMKTPYSVGKDEITGKISQIIGNKVKVIDTGELLFTVPSMSREGYYDLEVINPDTKKDSKTGNNGFYYSYQPEFNPTIENIRPKEGSVDGDYYINIKGTGFLDNGGDDKTSVIIGSIRVPSSDVEVSTDGTELKVKVPAYPGDLASETEMDRKTVAVVVLNPDGGSASREDGFTYIIPISHPKIDKLILPTGTAAGGESVIIEGSGFRYFEPYKDENNNGKYNQGEVFTNINGDKDEDGKDKWTDLRYWLNDENKKDYKELVKDYDKLVRPILPKVYFGDKEAKILDFTASTIEVESPKGQNGQVEVYVVNNDYGVSNKLNYNYQASNPNIENIIPNKGKKQGNDKIEILGSGFNEDTIRVISSKDGFSNQAIQKIQFGNTNDSNISNANIGIDALENSGRLRDRKTKVKVGNLVVEYDGSGEIPKLDFTITENKIDYVLKDVKYDNGEIFLPVNILKDKDEDKYDGYEYVKVSLEKVTGANNTKRLRVDRGFSPEARLKNPGHILVKTPSYYTVGENILVSVINADGGRASSMFEYKNPDSNPKITNVLSDGEEGYSVEDGRIIVGVNYTGGNTIEVIGSDFRKPVTLRIGDIIIPEDKIEYYPEGESISNKLVFKMDAVDEGYTKGDSYILYVQNDDGAFASSEPIEIKFTRPETTELAIEDVTPNFGPTEGGTLVTIKGKDFRSKMEDFPNKKLNVYFGNGDKEVKVAQKDIISVTFDKIVLRTPAYTAGLADIKVKNPDGNIVTLPNAFNYVSNPKIVSVVDPDNDKRAIQNISVKGEEKIKLIGNDFMEGAKVVFAPVLRELGKDEQTTGDVITVDTRRYLIESGLEGKDVEVVNGQTILVTTPAGKIGDKGVIVINPDKGATNIYNLVYGIPEIGSPFDVRAEIQYDEFIRVNWTGVKDALEYEVYMSEDDGKFEFIASTELTSFAVQKLRRNTRYQFLVKAIGQYGSSKPIDESKSNTVRTGRKIGPKDEDGELAEETVINRNGKIAEVIIGYRDFKSEGLKIDLTRGELAGVEDINIRIPAELIVYNSGDITVLGKDYSMNFHPIVFKNATIDDNRNNSDAGVVFSIAKHKENIDVNGGNTVIGERYMLAANMYVGKSMSSIDYLNGGLIFKLDHDILKAENRRLKNIKIARYDVNTKSWVGTDFVNRLGLYTVIGSRR